MLCNATTCSKRCTSSTGKRAVGHNFFRIACISSHHILYDTEIPFSALINVIAVFISTECKKVESRERMKYSNNYPIECPMNFIKIAHQYIHLCYIYNIYIDISKFITFSRTQTILNSSVVTFQKHLFCCLCFQH